MPFFIGFIIVLIIIVASSLRIVPQSKAYIIERLGVYKETWDAGLHFKIPVIDRVTSQVSLKEQIADFPPQPVITKDNVTMQIDTVVFFKIVDPKLFAYGAEKPLMAIENLAATTLRNIIGDLELDHTLTSRDTINAQITQILDEATDPWGIKVNRVELKNILPPREIQDAMEKQMKAERERREAILKAEGEKKSAILIAEGQKASQILKAEADKESKILEAEADKESQMRIAEGQAKAILEVGEAKAKAILMINKADPGEGYLKMRSYEAFEKASDGKSTKIIIPSEIQSLAGLAAGVKEVINKENEENE